MSNWVHYQNGNYTVSLNLDNGTKIRETIDPEATKFIANFPESMDVKISNRCPHQCPMCHENSTPDGKLGDILSYSFIDNLHEYTECAFGGGEAILHPDFKPFLEKCKTLKLIPNVTTNQLTFMSKLDFIKELVDNKLIYGLGISLVNPTDEFIETVKCFQNAVLHVINGLVTMEQLEKLKNNNLKILVLGYKEFRRGENLYEIAHEDIDLKKNQFYSNLDKIVSENWFNTISFDNLALKQLEVKRILSDSQWNQFYMGDDGLDGKLTSASMYIDMVEKKFARSSISTKRYNMTDDAQNMFKVLRNE